ncbi:MAG: hypothetical protein GY760_28230 [Deltaproteobacteria bacterium]|nr:hypothetical protein [Deltaproteobacteria bacterium]
MNKTIITELIADQKNKFKKINLGEEEVLPVLFINFEDLPEDFIIDYMDDAMEEFIDEDDNGNYIWKSEDVIPVAILGMYSLGEYSGDEEDNLPEDANSHQFYGMLFLNSKGGILNWSEGYIESFSDVTQVCSVEDLKKLVINA